MKRLQLFLMTLLMLLGSTASRAVEMYAVLNNNTLTFYYDNSKASRTGTKYNMNKTGNAPNWYNKTSITEVVFDASFADAKPTTCYGWFYGLEGLKTITGIGNLNTEKVESMYAMFHKCSKLTSLDVNGFSTANVTNMSFMFNNCSGVTTLDVSKFNTAKVTTFEGMFQNCTGLTNLDISSFTLKSSQNTLWMINKCSGLKSLTIPSTANVLDAQACSGIGTQSAPCALNFPSGFTPDKTHTGKGWYLWKNGYFKDGTTPTPSTTEAYAVLSGSTLTFYYDKDKASRSGTVYELNSGSNNAGWTSKASAVKSVVFDSSFEKATPTTTYSWFYNMTALTSIKGMEYLNTEKVTNMRSMFNNCTQLTSLNLGSFNTKNVTTMYRMFYNCTALKELFLYSAGFGMGEYMDYSSNFTTEKVTTMQEMFYGCKSLEELVLADFKVTSATNTQNMLKGCTSLEMLSFDQDMSALHATACTGIGTASKPCSLMNPHYLPESDQITPTYMVWKSGYFVDGLRQVRIYLDGGEMTFDYNLSYLSGHEYFTSVLNTGGNDPDWYDKINTKVVSVVFTDRFRNVRPTSIHGWFRMMRALTKIEGLENLNTEYVTDMGYLFSGDNKLESVDLSHFNTDKVTDMSYMFNSCTKLSSLDLSSFTFASDADTKAMVYKCSGLKTLTVPSTANNLASDACKGVGTTSAPCLLLYPDGFSPKSTSSGNGYYVWKGGYFTNDPALDIDAIAVDGISDGEWYNLQGQRVSLPHHGIFIRNGKKYYVK